MLVDLHQVCLDLQCDVQGVQVYWQHLFADWLESSCSDVRAQLRLLVTDKLPPLPEETPFFVDSASLPDDVGLLSVYQQGTDEVLLHFWNGALVHVPLAAERPFLKGYVLPKVLHYGRLEDITYTSLAPFLRRQGYFLVHAFGVCRDAQCLLIVGSSGSGKTTTGLSMIMAGWELLANDILLIEARDSGIYALPTPGGLSIRKETLHLLPDCQQLLTDVPCVRGKYNVTNQLLWPDHTPEAVRISAVYFCQIEEGEVSYKRPLSQALALTQLMEQSVDRWDEQMFNQHLNILQQLSQQANCYTLHLGEDVPRLPQLLMDKL